MSENYPIEQFNIENPPGLYSKRGSSFSTGSGVSDDIESNENIIFESDSSSLESDLKGKAGVKKECGLTSNSEISVILNIVVSAIGSGCFSFPYIMYDGGIVVSLVILLFMTACFYYTIDLLRSFVVDTKYFSFALMTETILGPKWLKLYAFCSFIIYTSMEVGYLSSIYIYIQGIFDFTSVWATILYFLVSMLIEIIICLYISKVSKMYLLSIISIICFTVLFFSLIIISIIANIRGDVDKKFTVENLFFPRISPDSAVNRLLKMSSYIMEYLYGYSYHSTFPTLIGNLHTINNSTTKRVHLISFSIIFFSYLFMTIFGFILSDEVPQEVFKENEKHFTGVWAYLRIPYKITLCVYYLTLIPIRFVVVRDNYATLIGEKKITFMNELIIISVFIFISNIFVFGVGIFDRLPIKDLNIKTMLQAFGGMFGVIISFCLPVVNYVSVNGKKKIKSIIGYFITGFFVIVGFFSTAYTFYQLFFGGRQKDN